MRKLVVHMQTTLDGRISRPDGLFWEPFPWGATEMAYRSCTRPSWPPGPASSTT
jgi:hypothetical protein